MSVVNESRNILQGLSIASGQREAKGAEEVFDVLDLRMGLCNVAHRSLRHYGLSSRHTAALYQTGTREAKVLVHK